MLLPARDAAGTLTWILPRRVTFCVSGFSRGAGAVPDSGRQLDQVHDRSHSSHPADAFPANAFGEGRRRITSDGRDPVVGANFGERQSGDLPGFHEFENSVFDAFVRHGWLPVSNTPLTSQAWEGSRCNVLFAAA